MWITRSYARLVDERKANKPKERRGREEEEGY